MIAKALGNAAKSRFGILAYYIAGAKEKDEKLVDMWLLNCDACVSDGLENEPAIEDINLELAILEIETTQGQNTRSRADKSYHLLISFQEGERPTKKELREIELEFAKALGFAEHQRIVAAHDNTKNFHLHVAINKVHPSGFQCIAPAWDHYKLRECCRKIEQKYNLAINPDKSAALTPGATDYEANTFLKSFERFCRENKETILGFSKQAKSWDDFHKALGSLDLGVKPRGNGIVFFHEKHNIKASAVDRSLSKLALERRWGAYKQRCLKQIKRKNGYKPTPLFMNLHTKLLWGRYLGQRKQVGHTLLSNWKTFLLAQVITEDALAATIITSHRAIIGTLFPRYTQDKKPVKSQLPDVQKSTEGLQVTP